MAHRPAAHRPATSNTGRRELAGGAGAIPCDSHAGRRVSLRVLRLGELLLLDDDRHRLPGLRIDDVLRLRLLAHAAADREGGHNGE